MDIARNEDLAVGMHSWNANSFYREFKKYQMDASEIWKCIIRNKMVGNFLGDEVILKTIFKSLYRDQDYIILILEELLEKSISNS